MIENSHSLLAAFFKLLWCTSREQVCNVQPGRYHLVVCAGRRSRSRNGRFNVGLQSCKWTDRSIAGLKAYFFLRTRLALNCTRGRSLILCRTYWHWPNGIPLQECEVSDNPD